MKYIVEKNNMAFENTTEEIEAVGFKQSSDNEWVQFF